MRERGAVRVVPKSAVTVAIDQGLALAYGVVANISEKGACIWTSGSFKPGENLLVRLSFPNEPQPVQLLGRVVWSGPGPQGKEALRYGIQWGESREVSPARLKTLIGGAARD